MFPIRSLTPQHAAGIALATGFISEKRGIPDTVFVLQER
jgi:hypothetical protein